MRLIVQKYGGTSVGSAERIKNVAKRIVETQREGCNVVAVISAMAGVTDDEILAAQKWLASNEGIFVEPASAAPIAGLLKQVVQIPEASRIVCTVTGHGLKDPDIIQRRIGKLEPVPANIDKVRQAIGF